MGLSRNEAWYSLPVELVIYHNPRCGKSRDALKLLRERGVEPRVVRYLETPPDAAELRRILKLLGVRPRDLLRTGEAAYGENHLDDPGKDDDALVDAMVRHPILIQRPIVIAGGRAVIGRPPERVLELLSG
jgi:arsenate reductase